MKTTTIKNWRTSHDVIVMPMNVPELKEFMTKAGRISAKVLIDFNDLVRYDQEWLNDEVSERITNSVGGLVDISFKVVGRTNINQVIVLVEGEIDFENI